MKRNVKELKRIARGNLQGNFAKLIRVFVFCNLRISLVETPFSMMTNEVPFSTPNLIYFAALILITIVSVVLTVGQYCLHLRIARGGEMHLSEFFYPIKYDANRLILAETALWLIRVLGLIPAAGGVALIYFYDTTSMYLIALGLFILSLILIMFIEISFGLTYFTLIDNEELSVGKALKKTLEQIRTHRARFLYLEFSFIGMYLLVFLTFGIGFLWVQPYVIQTTTIFYLDINGELEKVASEHPSFDQYV